ncbi:MAG: FmdB family transcriptional regulator [Chloroflexi bacterium HGW-Chloroflexi-3]|nr:MAG: FmdB family transcriptional regulator [Chloroflexi bacterium HGW-Chloroflexi-3]
MPVYTYRCDNCGVQFDRRQSFTDPLLKVCPDCGKKALHKVYTPVGIVFKGSGFYATDHRSPSGQNKTKSSHEEKSSDSSASDSPSNDSSSKKSTESSAEKTTSSTNSNPN